MRDKRKLTTLFILAISAACLLNGCKKNDAQTEAPTDTQTETAPAQTEEPKNTYTSESSTFSMDLPDASWTITKEGINNRWAFKSAGTGTITIVHKKSKIGAKKLPKTQEEAAALLDKEAQDAFQNVEYKTESASGAELYYYAAEVSDTGLAYEYYVRYLVSAEKEGYIITAKLLTKDAQTVQAVKDAVTSFQILREDSKKVSDSKDSKDTDDKKDSQGEEKDTDSSGSGDDNTETTDEEYRYFFDEEGNTVYAYPSEDGAWRDKNGMAYKFMENGVEDSNGTKYYYDPPEYRDGASGSSIGAESLDPGTVDFYDSNGNYITAVQDENGNWVGSDGKTYTFSEDGVTDSDGNFSKW